MRQRAGRPEAAGSPQTVESCGGILAYPARETGQRRALYALHTGQNAALYCVASVAWLFAEKIYVGVNLY